MGELEAGDLHFLTKSGHLSDFLGVFLLTEKYHLFYFLPKTIHGPLQAFYFVGDAVLKLAKKGSVGWGELQLGDCCSLYQ